MLLMPPASRWKTTFTTCGSGSEDYVWQAVRADLAEANDARKLPGVIDLTQAHSGKDSPYASFAKTGKGQLPWQQSASVVPDGETDSAPPIGSQAPLSSTHVTPPLHSQEVTNASGSTTAPQLDSSNAMQGQGSQPKKRRLSELSKVPLRVPPKKVKTSFLRNAGLVVASSLFLALIALAAIYPTQISAWVAKVIERFSRQPIEVEQVARSGEGGSTFKAPSEAEEKDWRKEKEDADKKDNIEQELEDFEKRWSPKYEDRLDGLIAKLKQNIRRKEKETLEIQQQDAFSQFEDLSESVSFCSTIEYSSSIEISPLNLGPLQWDALIKPTLGLAMPKGFSAQVKEMNVDSEADDGIKRMWGITVKGASVGDESEITIARIFLKSDKDANKTDCLWICPTKEFNQDTNDGQNFLLSKLLLMAKNPKSGKFQTRAVQLFKPEAGSRVEIDFFQRRLVELNVTMPREIKFSRSWDELTFFIKVDAPCNKAGDVKETVYNKAFNSRNFPTKNNPFKFPLLHIVDVPGTIALPFEYQKSLLCYKEDDKPGFYVGYLKEIRPQGQLEGWYPDNRPISKADFGGIFEEKQDKFEEKRSEFFARIDRALKTPQYRLEVFARKDFTTIVSSLSMLCDNKNLTGWLKGYWEEAKKENKKNKKQQAEDEKEGRKYPIISRFENEDEWMKKIREQKNPEIARKIYKEERKKIIKYFKKWYTNFSNNMRQCISLIVNPPTISINRLETVAYGRDGREYPVVLIDQDAQPPEGNSSNDGQGASLN